LRTGLYVTLLGIATAGGVGTLYVQDIGHRRELALVSGRLAAVEARAAAPCECRTGPPMPRGPVAPMFNGQRY
jgi:hypothetical protein